MRYGIKFDSVEYLVNHPSGLKLDGWLDGQTYKQAKEQSDLMPLLINLGWVKTIMCVPGMTAEDKGQGILGIIINMAANVLKMPGKRYSLVIVRGREINRVLEQCYKVLC